MMKHLCKQRLLALILALVLIFQALPLEILASDLGSADLEPTDDSGYGKPELELPYVIGEVEELRTEDEKQFQMSDGSYLAVSYGMPVHYQVEDGAWANLDNTLRPVSAPGGNDAFSACNGESVLSFAAELSSGALFTTSHSGKSVSMSLYQAPPSAPEQPENKEAAEDISAANESVGAGDDLDTTSTDLPMQETLPADHTEPVDSAEPTAPETTGAPEATDDASPEDSSQPSAAHAAPEPDGFNRSAKAQLVSPEPMVLAAETTGQQSITDAIVPDTLNSAVLYENVYPGVDLLYNVSGYNIKESIVVKERLNRYRFSFQLNLAGLTPQMAQDGSVVLLDENGNVSYYVPAPYLFDAEHSTSNAAAYELSGTAESGYVLTVEADPAWMDAIDRTYPVTIDPTLVRVAGNASGEINATYVVQGDPATSHGHYQDLYFGYSTAAKEHRIYMHFSKLPELPVGSVVVNATLNLWQFNYSHVQCPEMNIGVYEVTEDMSGNYSSYHNWLYYMTWNNKPAYDSSNMIDYTTASAVQDDRYLTWELTELVNKWYNAGTANRTVALVGTEVGSYSSSFCALPSFYAYGRNHPPILTVSYRNNTGIEPYYTYQSMSAGHAGTAYISDFSSQLTVAKELFTFASTTNPFSVQLVYNSAYFSKRADTQYDLGKDLGMEMHFGSGCTYNFIQHVKKETIDGITYIRYLDGDGTIHYFAKDAEKDLEVQRETGADKLVSYYYDEDGLGLKIQEYAPNYYSMSDDHGNEWVFVYGPLLWIKDDDGNAIRLHYSKNGAATSNDYPTGAKDRLEKITQRNAGGAAVTIATFSYQSHTPNSAAVANYVDTITDYAGNRYSFEYQHGKLITIAYNGQPIARYTMRIGNNWLLNELIAMTDVEAGYTLSFTYTNHKVSSVEESAAGAAGSKLTISQTEDRRTLYRDFGQDRTSETTDDILTYYGFDYAGRTVNAYTTDSAGNILGASNAAYSGTGSTDRINNRTLRTAAIGVAAQQELRNFGFESTASDVAWQLHKSSGDSTATVNAVVNTDKPRTGSRSFKTWITPGKTGLTGAAKASNVLQANTTYILSAYVNTSQAQAFSGKGIYLQVTDSSGNIWKSPCVNYKTSALVDGGWVRVALTFQTKVKSNHTAAVYNDGVGGAVFADDMQLEWSRAPVTNAESADTQAVSNVNLLENGSLQHWGYGWTTNSGASFASGVGVHSASDYAYSIRVTGNPKANHYASQTVSINLPGSQTYVLSGWAKANSVPDNKLDGDPEKDKEAAAKDKNKQFGLRAVLTYAGGGTEYHYAPFNPELRDWQFTSLTIVPRQADKTVSTIRVECAYEKNANTAWFDDLSLVREAAQTMRYDEKGNLLSVTTTGLKPDADTYQNGNLIRSVTGGYGTYTYTYDQTHKHRLKSVTNDLVTQTMDYDASGNVKTTTLKSNTSSYLKTLHTAAAYTSNHNLVESVTDSSKQSEFYAYGDKQSVMTGQATSVRDADGNVTTTTYDTMGRVFKKGFVNSGKLNYNYREGLLTNVIRTDAAGKMQAFAYGHDGFGNLTGIMVDGVQLISYQYGPKNGALQKQTYGNGDSVSFEYDNLGRITKSTYSSGRILTYTYTGDGQLYSITDNGATPGNSADEIIYTYTYDTLGRVINCQARRGIQVLLQTHWEYDDCNRVKSQGWQMGSSSYRETYTYSQKDGSLTRIDTEGGGNSLQLAYDPLQRLATAGNGVYTKSYTYRDISSTQTTSQVRKLQYSGLTGLLSGLSFHYTYNSMGNLASVAQGNDVPDTYTYDAMGQLTQANCLYRGDSATYQYAYNSTGNLTRTSFYSPEYPDDQYTNTYRYSKYTWQDLLTEFNGEKLLYEGQSLSASGTVTGKPKSGNPISYFNGTRWRFGWTEGRNLTQAEASTDSSDTVLTFAYDLSGLRTDKRVVKKTYDTVLVHSYATTVVAPTCTEGGYTLHSCDCGDSYRTNTTAALGHSYVETGLDTYTCSRCGNTYSDHTHRYTTTVVEPTCTQTGYTTHTCACGHTYQDNAVAELGHDYQRVSQTMTQITYQCTRCGHRHTSPIYDINPPKPPISEYSLDAASTGCASKRLLKSTVTQEHSYLYAGDKLLRETISGNGPAITLDFRYDNLGLPYSLTYQKGAAAPVTYYYITNLQGDVMYLVDSQGSQAAAYTYDPFGKTLSAEGPMAELNPLRYRGYYQDGETGFYYLQSRYYDPAICRFLNADSYASTGQSYLGYNAFAYCGNNPINRADADGEFWDIVFDVVSLGFSIADVIQNPSDPMAWAGLVGDVVDVAVPFVSGVGEATKAVGAVADVADVVDDVHDAARAMDNVEDAIDAGGDLARKTDFYVTPGGEAIPASRVDFENNLSKLDIKNGKYIGDDSQGPIRIRSNEIHIDNPGYKGPTNPYHTQPHFHIDRKVNGSTGKWVKTYTGLMHMLY